MRHGVRTCPLHMPHLYKQQHLLLKWQLPASTGWSQSMSCPTLTVWTRTRRRWPWRCPLLGVALRWAPSPVMALTTEWTSTQIRRASGVWASLHQPAARDQNQQAPGHLQKHEPSLETRGDGQTCCNEISSFFCQEKRGANQNTACLLPVSILTSRGTDSFHTIPSPCRNSSPSTPLTDYPSPGISVVPPAMAPGRLREGGEECHQQTLEDCRGADWHRVVVCVTISHASAREASISTA